MNNDLTEANATLLELQRLPSNALDNTVIDVFCLTRDDRNEVYRFICEPGKNRLGRARSV